MRYGHTLAEMPEGGDVGVHANMHARAPDPSPGPDTAPALVWQPPIATQTEDTPRPEEEVVAEILPHARRHVTTSMRSLPRPQRRGQTSPLWEQVRTGTCRAPAQPNTETRRQREPRRLCGAEGLSTCPSRLLLRQQEACSPAIPTRPSSTTLRRRLGACACDPCRSCRGHWRAGHPRIAQASLGYPKTAIT